MSTFVCKYILLFLPLISTFQKAMAAILFRYLQVTHMLHILAKLRVLVVTGGFASWTVRQKKCSDHHSTYHFSQLCAEYCYNFRQNPEWNFLNTALKK